ncbi:hypothetical protein HK096_001790 [Nowakowskiella sp. JEL0078]|nr:hypothetical protein HK096_001790 [Nowakowskiella sp. JEL0078]
MEDDGDEDWMTDDEKSVSSAKNRSGQSTKFSETSLATEKLVFSTASAPRKAKQKERKLNQKSCNNTFSSNSVSSSSLQGLGFQKESHSSSSQKNLIGLYRTSESNLELLGQKNRMNSQYKEGDSFKPQSEKQVGSNAEPPAALIKPKKKVKISQSSLYEQNKKTKEDVGLTFNFGSKISSTQSFEVEKESKFLEQNKKDKAFKGKKQKPRANSKLGLIVVDEADHKKSGIDNQCVLEDQKNLKAENAYDGVLSLTLKLKQENGCLNSDNNEIFNSGKREIEESKSKRKQNSKNTG